jgi:hypothetical protein
MMFDRPKYPLLRKHMLLSRMQTITTRIPNLRVAQLLTAMIVLLALIASAGGLFINSLYRDPASVLPAIQGQDLVTLLALPALVAALFFAQRGSARAIMALLGLLSYVCYAYTGAAFAYAFNAFFLMYVALFSLSVSALIAIASGINVIELQQRFDSATPRRPVGIALIALALMLAASELGQIIPSLTTGTVPELITRSGGAGNFVYVLDLGIVVPLALLAAIWLWRGLPWGDVLAGCILIKASTMGLALLSATWFSVSAGLPLEIGLTIVYGTIAIGGLGMTAWFFRHCRG